MVTAVVPKKRGNAASSKRLSALAAGPEITALLDSYALALRADDKAKSTVINYVSAARDLAAFLAREGLPTRVGEVELTHLRHWQVWQLQIAAQTSASVRHGWLLAFWKWCVSEGYVAAPGPMAGLRQPAKSRTPRPVLSDEHVTGLLRVCERMPRDFLGLRDAAFIRFLLDTGARRAGAAALSWRDVDWQTGIVCIHAKRGTGAFEDYYGRLGKKALRALDRYRRAAEVHPQYVGPHGAVWIGQRGPLSRVGLYQALKRRAVEAKLDPDEVTTHLFRHTFAHQFLAAGGSERDLRKLGNWRSDVALKYGAVLDMERALTAKEHLSLSDRF